MADNFRANFIGASGTAISSYTPDVGSIIDISAGGVPILKGNNTIRANSGAIGVSIITDVPSSPDWAIQWTIKAISTPSDQFLNLYLRYVKASTARMSFILDVASAVFYIADQSTGFSVVAGPTAFTATVGTAYTFLFQVSGTTYTVYKNGVSVLSGTNSSLSAAGQVAFEINDSSSAFEISSLRAFPTGSPTAPTAIAPNDSHILYDPVGWLVNSSYAITVNSGSTFRLNFTTSSYIKAYFDTTNYGSDVVTMAWRLDDGDWVVNDISSSVTGVVLANGLSLTGHVLHFVMVSAVQNDSFSPTPIDATKITSFELDVGGTILSITDTKPYRAISYGDSITRQTKAGPAGVDDTRYTYVGALWNTLNAEYSNISFGTQGWVTPFSYGGGPAFFTPGNDTQSSYNKIYSGVSRTFTNINYISVFLGTNDGGSSASTVANSVSGWLTAIRTPCPTAKIFILAPFWAHESSVVSGVANYKKANTSDRNVWAIDLGTIGATGINTYPNASWLSVDGLHANTFKHTELAALWSNEIRKNLDVVPLGNFISAGAIGH